MPPPTKSKTVKLLSHYTEKKGTHVDQILYIRAHTKEVSFNQATEWVVTELEPRCDETCCRQKQTHKKNALVLTASERTLCYLQLFWNVLNDRVHPFESDCQALARFLSRQTEYIAFEERRSLGRDRSLELQKDMHKMCDETFSTTDSSSQEAWWLRGGGVGEGVVESGEKEGDGVEGEAISSFDN